MQLVTFVEIADIYLPLAGTMSEDVFSLPQKIEQVSKYLLVNFIYSLTVRKKIAKLSPNISLQSNTQMQNTTWQDNLTQRSI